MSVVVDASAWVAGVIGDVAAETVPADGLVPAHFDAEVVSGLRGVVRGGRLAAEYADEAIDVLRSAAFVHVPLAELVEEAWRLSQAVSAYDAFYVALARREGVALHTADARLARGAAELCDVVLLA